MTTKSATPVRWQDIFIKAPALITLAGVLIGGTAVVVPSVLAIDRHEEALQAINGTLIEIRDDMRTGYVSRSDFELFFSNFEKLNPDVRLPALVGR